MNEYVDKLYEWIGGVDDTFEARYEIEDWKNKLAEDEQYRIDLYEWIAANDNTFKKRHPFEEWVEKVKKKDFSYEPTSQEDVTESTTETVQETPTSSDVSATRSDTVVGDQRGERGIRGEQETFEFEAGRRHRGQPIDEDEDRDRGEDIDESASGEKDTWIERKLGKWFLTDLFGDIYRAGDQGVSQGAVVDDALKMFGKGGAVSDEDIAAYLAAVERMNEHGMSDEMKSFNKIYEEEGGGVWGFIKGVAANPTVAPQLFTSSVTSMLNPASLTAAGTTIGTGTAAGAGAGSLAGGVGALPGAGAGFISSIPWAIGAAGGTLETGLSFSEFLQEEIANKGLKLDKEGVRAVLTDPDAMFRIRSKAAGRGITIGLIDRYTAGLASNLTKTVAKQTGKKVLATGAGIGTEAVGGSVGEAAARGITGQEMDVAEIGFEGIAGTSTAPITVGYGLYKSPTYKINGETRSGPEMAKFIRESPDKDFAGMEVEITNDPELKAIAEERKNKLKKKSSIIEQLGDELEGMSDEDRDRAVELEIKLNDLDNNASRLAKKRKEEYENELDGIYNKYDKQRTQPSPDTEITVSDQEVIESFKEDGVDINNPEEVKKITAEQITQRRQELLTKKKQDAIQESSTEKVDVQVQTEDGPAVGEGDSPGTTTPTQEGQTKTDTQTPTETQVDPDVQEEVKDLETLLQEQEQTTQPEVTTETAVENAVVEDTNTGEIKTQRVNDGKVTEVTHKGKRRGKNNLFITEDVTETTQEGVEVEPTPQQNKIISLAEKALQTISRVLPNVNVVLHKSEQSFNNSVSDNAAGDRGAYVPSTKTIHVNIGKANARTIAHEVFHALLHDKIGTDVEIANVTKRMVTSVAKRIKDPKIKKELNDFIKNYDENYQNEEYLSELIGMLANNYTNLDAPQKSVIRRWAEKIAKKFGLDKVIKLNTEFTENDEATVSLLNTVSKSLREGKVLKRKDIKTMDTLKKQPETKKKTDTTKKETKKKETKKKETKKKETKKKTEDKKKPDEKTQKSTEEAVLKLAFQSGINTSSFLPANLWNPSQLRKRLKEYGYTLKPHYRSYGDRGLTGYSIRRPNGSMVKIPAERRQVSAEKLQKSLPKDLNPMQLVNFARENNFSRAAIRDVLIRKRNLSAKEADALLDLKVDLFNDLPASFGDIGIRDGIKLFKRVTEYAAKLSKLTGKKKLSPQQIQEKTLEFLENQKEYKDQSDKGKKTPSTRQNKMYVDMQKSLGVKPTIDIAAKVNKLKSEIRQRKRGETSLQDIKRKLRNYMRQTLPADIYNKSEVMKMVRKITDATDANIDNLMTEVLEFTTEKQVASLEQTIKNILEGKYETVQAGRKKGKKIDTPTKNRLDRIKDNFVAKLSETAKEVVAQNLKLNKLYNELAEKTDATIEEQEMMVDLLVAMSINNAMLMDNTDTNKVDSLGKAEDILAGILGEGRQKYKEQMAAAHKKYKDQFQKVYKDVTGESIDLDNPDSKKKMTKDEVELARRRAKENAKKGVARFFSKLGDRLKSFFNSSESLAGLMDIIANAPGVVFGGNARKLVYEVVNAGTRVFKKRMMENQKVIEKKMREIFGRKWRKENRKNTQDKVRKDIYIDPEAVEQAEIQAEVYPTRKNKRNLRKVKDKNTITLSNNKIAYLWQQYQDPGNIPSFANPKNKFFGPDHQRIMKELLEDTGAEVIVNKEGNLEVVKSTPLLDFANWQVEEFFPSVYGHYNKAYQSIYRTNLPWNKHYAGRIYREGRTQDPLDLLGDKEKFNNQVGASSTKMRIANDYPIEPVDVMDSLLTYVTDMEWFASMGPGLRDINKIFGNASMRRAIEDNHGKSIMRLIDHSIKNIAARGIQEGSKNKIVNSLNDVFIATRLGLNPSLMVKQMTSMFTYMTDIGPVNYTKYAIKNIPTFIKTWKEIWKNSVYVQDRASTDLRRTIESYSNDAMVRMVPKTTNNMWVNIMMSFVKIGDMGAIMIGGMPNYAYYKAEFKKNNPNATEQQAIDYAIVKFEDDTKNTQQSMDLQDKDYYQSSDAITRSLNMFLTTPKQYLRKEFAGIRNMRRGARDKNMKQFGKGFSQVLMYHAIMPTMFQYVVLGLPGILRKGTDEDNEDLIRAAILGNFNALFIVGDMLTGLADAIQEKAYVGKMAGIVPFQIMNEITQSYVNWQKTKDPDKKAVHRDRFLYRLGELGSHAVGLKIPFYNIKRFVDNAQKASEADDTGEIILRMMNYSDYHITKGDLEVKSSFDEDRGRGNIDRGRGERGSRGDRGGRGAGDRGGRSR